MKKGAKWKVIYIDKQETEYEIERGVVGSEMYIRSSSSVIPNYISDPQ